MAKPIQILKASGHEITIETDLLFPILDQLGEINIEILSITGINKTGKSFLLNFFLSLLKNKNRSQEFLNGFNLINKDETQASGIWMWSEPFILTDKDGSKSALLLLDTKGLSLDNSSFQSSGCIFALSLVLSTFIILNFQSDLSDDCWDFFEYFAHYAQTINLEPKSQLFQRLVFVSRDWNDYEAYQLGYHDDNTSEENNFKKTLINRCLKNKPIRNINTRKRFMSYFEDVGCYLLPHPGNLVTQQNFFGKLELIDKDFKENVEKLFWICINKIKAKKIGYSKLTAELLKKYLSDLNEKILKPNHDLVYERACDLYEKNIRNCIELNVSDVDFFAEHTKAQEESFKFVSSQINDNQIIVLQERLHNRTLGMSQILRLKNLERLELNKCIAFSTGPIETVFQKPVNLVNLELQCPGYYQSWVCGVNPMQWYCNQIGEPMEYGFDGYFYCSCGRAKVESYRFKCNSKDHSKNFIQFNQTILKKLLDDKEINILILGETGVGKSTWINGFVNYITYSSLDEARMYPLLSLIASSFTITDCSFQMHEIVCGEDPNELLITGQSSTKGPKAYTFLSDNKLIRLIDTPGIGDTRGVTQDKKNFDAILRYISNKENLHGICILLKPNNSRLGTMFRFCIKELLTHLHRDASRNIVFCFTNARNTFYRPGDSMPALQTLLRENKDVKIELSKDTVYCMDNESFRFLCALHHGIEFDDKQRNNYSESWAKSVSETKRMVEYISGLTPHLISDTLSLNKVRNMIVNISKPMADITQNILININVGEDKKREIENSKEREKEIKKILYLEVIQLEAKQLGYPRTVCTNKGCVKYHSIEGTNVNTIEYTTHCHEKCYLTGVTPESYPNRDLLECAAMAGTNNCLKCDCPWELHMHITYEQKQVKVKVKDKSIKDLLKNKKSVRQAIELQIKNIEEYVKEQKDEKDTIRKVSVKFGGFLKANSIVPYNDALGEYLDVLIRLENDKVSVGGDRKTLEGLVQTKKEYIEEKELLDKYMKSGNNTEPLTPKDMMDLVKKLYSLKHNGEKLKEIMDVKFASKTQHLKYQEINYRSKYRGAVRRMRI